MGRRLPARAGGERHLSLRFRLLAAAAGIVATSLLLSGALTWFLVRNVELQAAQDSVDRSVQVSAMLVRHQECLLRTGVATNAGPAACRLTDGADFSDRLNSSVVPTLGGARLLLLGRQRQVLYDSQDPANTGVIDITASKRVANVAEAQPVFGGEPYLAAAMAIAPARDPLSAAYVVVARPESAVTTAAASELVPRLLVAGGAALMVALVLVLIVSRSVTKPLTQLAGAAEDIAGGNYSRRVGIRGPDEIGHLCQSCRQAGVRVALAGSLGAAQIVPLRACKPDWFAVRGAVCTGGRREQAIDVRAVRRLASLVGNTLHATHGS